MQLIAADGHNCGHFDGDTAPDGYWLRADDAPDRMTALQFLDKIGPTRFDAVWSAAIANSAVAFPMARGLAAQEVLFAESYPTLIAMEQAGLLPAGTAKEIWG